MLKNRDFFSPNIYVLDRVNSCSGSPLFWLSVHYSNIVYCIFSFETALLGYLSMWKFIYGHVEFAGNVKK